MSFQTRIAVQVIDNCSCLKNSIDDYLCSMCNLLNDEQNTVSHVNIC